MRDIETMTEMQNSGVVAAFVSAVRDGNPRKATAIAQANPDLVGRMVAALQLNGNGSSPKKEA